MKDVTYIANRELLSALCRNLGDSAWLAIDTEFIRDKTYYPRLALIQIANTDSIYCIDPLEIEDLTPFFELIENQTIIKILHAAAQDLEIFFNLRERLPRSVFDTQIAASLLGLGEQIGYAALTKKLLGIELDKLHTRTDWFQRPLGEEQIRYAADDVRYLGQLYLLLSEKLKQLDRLNWMDSEQERLLNEQCYRPNLEYCWQRIKGAGKLKRRQLNILKHLAAWREQQAIQSNRPRRWILNDNVLLSLAIQQPADPDQLTAMRLQDYKLVERYTNELLEVIQVGQKEAEETWPVLHRAGKPSAQEDATVDLLMAVARLLAEEQQLSPGQLTSRSELLKFIRGERNLPLFNGWRQKIAGQTIRDTFEGKLHLVRENGRTSLKCV